MNRTIAILLAAWIVAVTTVSGVLLARHSAPLPPPVAARLSSGLEMLRGPDSGRVVAFHVLLGSCRCSRQTARTIARSDRPIEVEEHVLLVDDVEGELRRQFDGAPFVLHDVRTGELYPHYGMLGVPLLVIVRPGGEVVYSGGYSERKQGLVSRDLKLIAAVGRGETPASLPLFGCEVASDLRRQRNPVGLP